MKPESRPYLTTLTPLRGIAALLLVIFHCNLMYSPFLPQGYTQFLYNCPLWVDFFFVLSGFIMSYTYKKYFYESVNKRNYKKFLGARFARVYPLNIITTLWAFVCSSFIVHLSANLDPLFAEIFNLKALPACLLLIQSMHIGYITPPLNTPAWSLSTEWWVYMIFPFILPLFIRLRRSGKIIVPLLIITFYIVLKYMIGPISQGNNGPTIFFMTDFGFLRCVAGFFTGMLLYTFYEHHWGYNLVKRDWFFILVFSGVMVAMHFGLMDIIIIAFFPLIIISAACNQTAIKRILDTRVLQKLGDWSFTIYMVHVPIIWTLYIFRIRKNPVFFSDIGKFFAQKPDFFYGLAMCLLIIALTLATSSIIYRFVEVPARNYLNGSFKTNHKDPARRG